MGYRNPKGRGRGGGGGGRAGAWGLNLTCQPFSVFARVTQGLGGAQELFILEE